MEIKRDRYLNLLIIKKHNGLIKVITGMRRCGKSYLLFTLFKDYLLSEGIEKSHIIEIAFDAYENKQYRDPDVLYPYLKEQLKDDGMYYVLLDEVQLLGEFEAILNSPPRMKNVDVYVTGSNARSTFVFTDCFIISLSSPVRRMMTRSTFPSTAGTGIPYAIDAMAPAV